MIELSHATSENPAAEIARAERLRYGRDATGGVVGSCLLANLILVTLVIAEERSFRSAGMLLTGAVAVNASVLLIALRLAGRVYLTAGAQAARRYVVVSSLLPAMLCLLEGAVAVWMWRA